MKKRNLLMIVVSLVLVMALVGCGNEFTENTNDIVVENTQEQESVVEDVKDTQEPEGVIEGDAPIDDDVDSGLSGETLNLSNTTELNVVEKWGNTLNLPVYTFSYSEVHPQGAIYYLANNTDENNNYLEFYQLAISIDARNISPADAYDSFQLYSKDYDSNCDVTITGDANSAYITMYIYSPAKADGTVMKVKDACYIYDSATSIIYELNLRINKDSAIYGENVLEKSTADYREQLRDAVIALAN